MNQYFIHQAHAALSLRYRLARVGAQDFLFLQADVIGTGAWFKVAWEGGEAQHSRFVWEPYSFSLNPGLGYQKGPWSMALSYRGLERRVWDDVIFSDLPYPPENNSPTDTYNPFKLWLTLSYDLRAGQPPRSWWGKKDKK